MADHHRPRFHARPPTGYVNDPNGPVRVGDLWHLYFQYCPDTAQRLPVMWGHLSSPDLVRWDLHPPALTPHPEGPDRDGCWSGNTVRHANRLYAFYSGFRRDHARQPVLRAESPDGGQIFGTPRLVIPEPSQSDGVAHFRDPFVWTDGPDSWCMVVGSGSVDGRPSARLYRSTDLLAWTYAGPLVTADDITSDLPDVDLGQMWECPQVITADDRTAVIVGAWRPDTGIGGTFTLVGEATGGRLDDVAVAVMDDGPNFYAASVLHDHPSGPIAWGWVTEGRTAEWAIADDWSGVISLPRVLQPLQDRVGSYPLPELSRLRSRKYPVQEGQPGHIRADGIGAQFEVRLVLNPNAASTATHVRLSFGSDERLTITVDRAARLVTVDRTAASSDPRAHPGTCTFIDTPGADGTLTLRWFVDGSVGELFTGSGHVCTFRFYPTSPPPWEVDLTGLTGSDRVDVWSLSSDPGEQP